MKVIEKKFLNKVVAYIQGAMENDEKFVAIAANMLHDFSGIAKHGYNVKAAYDDQFWPRFEGWLRRKPDALFLMRYIQKRMKASGMKANSESCDTIDRVTSMAVTALKRGDYDLHFTHIGDIWVSNLRRK